MNDDKFAGKYRIPSARARWWDYGDHAAYFVTICTVGREWYFGEVVNEEMVLSELGRVAESEWLKTLDKRPDMNLQLDEYKVMPNHFHAIVVIGENIFNRYNVVTQCLASDDMNDIAKETQSIASLQQNHHQPTKNRFAPQSKNLGAMIRGYKSAVKSYATTNGLAFGWQPRFHDHIIRNDDEYRRIAEYIRTNPANWSQDRYNKNDENTNDRP